MERNEADFTLQNVVIKYLTDYLIEAICQEMLDRKLAMFDTTHELLPPWPAFLTSMHLNRFALLKAQAKEYIRQSQVRLILDPIARQLTPVWG